MAQTIQMPKITPNTVITINKLEKNEDVAKKTKKNLANIKNNPILPAQTIEIKSVDTNKLEFTNEESPNKKINTETKLHNCLVEKNVSRVLTAFFPPAWLLVPFVVDPRKSHILSYWGKPQEIITEPGVYYRSSIGREIIEVSTARNTAEINASKINDSRGNPIITSAIITWEIDDPLKASFDIHDHKKYLLDQAQNALRNFVTHYPFSASDDEASLKKPSDEMKKELSKTLQDLVNEAGIKIISFNITDIAYAPEIAKAMLAKQEAQANVDARDIISNGISSIANRLVDQLNLPQEKKAEQALEMTKLLLINANDNSKVLPLYHINNKN